MCLFELFLLAGVLLIAGLCWQASAIYLNGEWAQLDTTATMEAGKIGSSSEWEQPGRKDNG